MVNAQLQKELKRLTALFDWGHHLKVDWRPDMRRDIDGEVKDDRIIIYASSTACGSRILRHEFLDALISEAVKPYVEIINAQRRMISVLLQDLGEKAYQHKEKVIYRFERLLTSI